jgi:hypothetical protein
MKLDDYPPIGFIANYLAIIIYGVPVITIMNMTGIHPIIGNITVLLVVVFVWVSSMMCYQRFASDKTRTVSGMLKIALVSPFYFLIKDD